MPHKYPEENAGKRTPRGSAISVLIAQAPPDTEMMATPGTGKPPVTVKKPAVMMRSSTVRTRMTFRRAHAASNTRLSPTNEPVCAAATAADRALLPTLIMTIGLPAACARERGFAERRGVPDGLAVHGDDARGRMIHQEIDQIGHADHGLVAGCRREAQADIEAAGNVHQLRGGGPALRDQANGAVPQRQLGRYRGQRLAIRDIRESQAVGTEKAHSGGARHGRDLILQGGAVRAGFGESGGEDHRGLDTRGDHIAHGFADRGDRHDDVGRVDRPPDGHTGAVAFHPEYIHTLAVDRIQFAVKSVGRKVAQNGPGPHRFFSRTHQRDGARLEQAVERVRCHDAQPRLTNTDFAFDSSRNPWIPL